MKVSEIIGDWINRYLSRPDAVFLLLCIAGTIVMLYTLGSALAPVLTGLVIAFLLQGLVRRLQDLRVPPLIAITIALLLFLGCVLTGVLLVVPLLWQQLQSLVQLLPVAMLRLQEVLSSLAEQFPEHVTEAQIASVVDQGTRELGNISAAILENAFSQVFTVFGLVIYLVLVPISVFFLLKDSDLLLKWVAELLPKDRPFLNSVATEMNAQLGNYVRGKAIEIAIVGSLTFITFLFLGLNYAALLGVLVGISVLVPFVGAAIVTFPVFAIGVVQFGWSWDFAWVMIAYAVIQFFDGNILVPLLFSEAVDLHPITIIVAVLAFGGVAGVWGVFFAIPLATFIKAMYVAWPSADKQVADDSG